MDRRCSIDLAHNPNADYAYNIVMETVYFECYYNTLHTNIEN